MRRLLLLVGDHHDDGDFIRLLGYSSSKGLSESYCGRRVNDRGPTARRARLGSLMLTTASAARSDLN